jgi:hypothetical protein
MEESKGERGEPRLDVTALRAMARLVDVSGRTCRPTRAPRQHRGPLQTLCSPTCEWLLTTRRCRACGTNYTAVQ